MSIFLTATRVVVLYSLDKETGVYTLSLLERGGPIVQNKDFEAAKEEFNAALHTVIAIRNLHWFDDISMFRPNFLRTNHMLDRANFEYQELDAIS